MIIAVAVAIAAPQAKAKEGCEPAWSALARGVGGGEFPSVSALAVFDDGSGGGPALYAGGRFTTAGGVTVSNIARWDGEVWSPLGSGVRMECPDPCPPPAVTALAVFDDGSGGGPALYAGGLFDTAGGVPANCIAKWDGAEWSPLGSGTNSTVIDMAVFDDGSGPALYAAGQFREAGGTPAPGIAKWDGAEWSVPGGGVGGGVIPWVYALAVFDDGSGSGPALYAGGTFETAGGVPANRIAKWDGAAWSALAGGGTGGPVYALTVFDDSSGSGPALYAGGQFLFADRIAKWDGAAWSPLGSGIEGGDSPRVWALTVLNDGSGVGPALYAGGQFMTAGGVAANGIATWDGDAWSELAGGVSGGISALAVFDDGAGPALYSGGQFTSAGGVTASNIARWGCATCYADCDGSGELDFFDFLCFQNEFAAQTPYADCDGSGSHDFFDFLCFQNAFAAGCQ